mmetsp:Transcript_28501/g.85439  ORF Transcript_28501/g.85439 Transcript_28501/m.85439 type:complete len:273 (-) Transcript_28501:2888-3706(-)
MLFDSEEINHDIAAAAVLRVEADKIEPVVVPFDGQQVPGLHLGYGPHRYTRRRTSVREPKISERPYPVGGEFSHSDHRGVLQLCEVQNQRPQQRTVARRLGAADCDQGLLGNLWVRGKQPLKGGASLSGVVVVDLHQVRHLLALNNAPPRLGELVEQHLELKPVTLIGQKFGNRCGPRLLAGVVVRATLHHDTGPSHQRHEVRHQCEILSTLERVLQERVLLSGGSAALKRGLHEATMLRRNKPEKPRPHLRRGAPRVDFVDSGVPRGQPLR